MKILKLIVLMSTILIIIYIYNYRQISVFKSRNVNIDSEKINNDIKITQISDFHSNKLIDLEKLAIQIEKFNPDFIVLTGDIIDRKDEKLDTTFKFLNTISKLKKDIYYIKGNHEAFHSLYENLKIKMEELGIVVLEDENKEIIVNSEKLNITGLDFTMESESYREVDDDRNSMKNLNKDNYNILLRHSPNDIESILNGDEDLVLSGHTHGGQVRIPIIGSIIAPGQGFFPKYDQGKYIIHDTTLYIDSGLGNSTAQIRLLNPVQFSNITIK